MEEPNKKITADTLGPLLKIQNERFEYVAKATTDVIKDWDILTNNIYWGDSFEIRYHYKRGEDTNNADFWFAQIHPDDRDLIRNEVYSAMDDSSRTYWETQYRFRIAGDQYIFISDKAFIIRNDEGEAIRAVGALHDNTEIKKYETELLLLNEQLEKKAKDLLISNAELERFAYVASHDLQEPLRMVSSFLELLKLKYGSQLDLTAEKYIAFAVDGASRMKVLINDLLEYSRIGTQDFLIQSVDYTQVIARVQKLYQGNINENEIALSTHPLPVLNANFEQMVQLFQNLIGNAIKYRKTGTKLIIEVKSVRVGKNYQFSVSDNGIGFDMKFAEKIFIIFQRLHLKEDYPGTGIGLAICNKIITRHHGNLWVDSRPGEGSTFYFTIPNNLQENTDERN